ncbi:uncharacterized protein G2W53_034935 [Senna tora]|uniref:Retrotransposon gag domain-containing protein n=1 Tax=Senna tora TaxID=362788 RepID=A0A834W3H3_9FABA|nr:uncharacterized protein G2W53_034935 [Senna tora]
MEPDGTTNSTAKKKTPEQPPESAAATLLAEIAAKRSEKHPENADPQQKEIQKTPMEQASAATSVYDDLVLALLKNQDELKQELRASNCKITELEKPRSKSGSKKQSSRKTRRRKGESTSIDPDSLDEDDESSDSQSSDCQRVKVRRERYPFTRKIMETRMPKLRTPAPLGHYDGKTDPVAHINSFKAEMMYAGASDEAMCKAFPSMLKGDAQLWFSDLASESISSFKQLAKKFTKYFATSRTIKRTSHYLKNIIQGENEPLKDFLDRFTKVARQIQGLKHEVALNYLTDNLMDGAFCQSITKKPPSSMEELMDRSAKYIAIEEVGDSKASSVAKKDRAEHKRKFSSDEQPRDDRKRRDRKDSKYGRTGDRDNSRRDHQDRDRRRDEPPRENHHRNVVGTINVIAGGITRGTESTPQTRKKQVRSEESPKKDKQAACPSGIMATEIVDMRDETSFQRPSPEGDLEDIALKEGDPSKTTKLGGRKWSRS